MNVEVLLIVVGAFLSVLMTINAFFTRQTLQAITDVRLELAKLIVKHDAIDERSRVNQLETNNMKLEQAKIRERLHKLQGGQAQLIDWLENHHKK